MVQLLYRSCCESQSQVFRHLLRNDFVHDAFKSENTLRDAVNSNVFSEFEILLGIDGIWGPMGSAAEIRIASHCELYPITSYQLSQLLIFVSVLPVEGKRIAQEKQLFTMVGAQPRPLPRIDVSEVIQV